MTSTGTDISFDPYDLSINTDPFARFKRLRDERPLYYNQQHDFFAVSRFDDVERVFADYRTYSSARGTSFDFMKGNVRIPPGSIIFEDPPVHTAHRGLVSRVFTPKKMAGLESITRQLCAAALDPIVGTGRFDFVADLGMQLPMRVIGMLLGIPERDQEAIRDIVGETVRIDGAPRDFSKRPFADPTFFNDYIAWRAGNPSDDLMTELLRAEFEDETGTRRRLTREEIVTCVNVIAGAGNETTNRLIGWIGKVLDEHPDQRRQLADDRSLIPNAIEELLRYQPPVLHLTRYVMRDLELYGQSVPEGSIMFALIASANRDDRHFPNGDRFDIHRRIDHHLTFSYGVHFCLGAALARLEGRVALDEVLNRFPVWEVDLDNARLAETKTRGWATLPTFV